MKKFLTLFLAIALVASLGICTYAADFTGNGVIKMGTAAIDGELDPAYTGSLNFQELGTGDNVYGSAWRYTCEANIYMMYDDKNLYIFAEVFDDDTFTKGPDYCAGDNPYVNDCVEFRLNFDGKDGAKNHKVSIDAYGFSCFGLKSAGSYDIIDYANLEYATNITDFGYNVEVAIPCSKGGTDMIKAGKLGFTYQLNDITASGGHQGFSSSFVGEPSKTCVFYNLSTEKAVAGTGAPVTPTTPADTTAPKVETTAPKAETTAPKAETTAPKAETTAPDTGDTTAPDTFDPFVVAVALTAASGAAFVVASKKKH